MTCADCPQPWEIWLAEVRYEDMPSVSKRRPVLIISNEIAYVLSLKITSQQPRSNYYGEYVLLQWQKSGLSKPSIVRVSKKLKLVSKDFYRKIGRAAPIDILNIRKLLNNK